METARYTHEPEPVLADPPQNGFVRITVTANPRQIDGETWEADWHEFWERPENIDLQAVADNPAAYLDYVPVDVKARAEQAVQERLDAALDRRVSLPCEPIGHPVIYDRNALINATAIFMDGGCPAFICADNTVTALDAEGARALKETLQNHRQSLYATATAARAALAAAQSATAVQAVLDSLTL